MADNQTQKVKNTGIYQDFSCFVLIMGGNGIDQITDATVMGRERVKLS